MFSKLPSCTFIGKTENAIYLNYLSVLTPSYGTLKISNKYKSRKNTIGQYHTMTHY
jgi:hypothetical protein